MAQRVVSSSTHLRYFHRMAEQAQSSLTAALQKSNITTASVTQSTQGDSTDNRPKNKNRWNKGKKGNNHHQSDTNRQSHKSPRQFHNSNSKSPHKSPRQGHPKTKTPCTVYKEDFSAFLRSVDNLKFKVHKPQCSCPKVKGIRERISGDDSNLQGLVVVPDSGGKFLPSVFLHPTDESEDLENKETLLKMELQLKDSIFPRNAPQPDIKVSCASCLLAEVPNGFVCVNSETRSQVESARDTARRNAQELRDAGIKLHHDHAHHVVVLDSKLLPTTSGRDKKQRGKENLNANPELREMLANEGLDMEPVTVIILGHHIKSLLAMMMKKKKKKEYYFLAIVFEDNLEDGSVSIEIDLPGGKRHLGEAAFDCAIRETQEETSLLVDANWHRGDGTPLKNASKEDFCNNFYDLQPPTETVEVDQVDDLGAALSNVQIS